MHHEIEIEPSLIAAARGTDTPPADEQMIKRWAARLSDDSYIPTYAVDDLFIDLVPLPSGREIVTALTGEQSLTLLHHPGRETFASGGQHYTPATVASAVLIAARLGVPAPAMDLIAPLRRKLARSRDFPLLTPCQLRVLWGPHESKGVQAFRYIDAAPPNSPYAVRLHDERMVLGFANPANEHVEVVGNRGIYAEAERRGCRLTRGAMKELIEGVLA